MDATIESIYTDFHDRLLGFISGRVADPATAEDILQDVYLKIHTRIDSLRESERIESWIYQITRNAIIDHYRRRRPHEALPDTLPAEPEEEPEAAAQLARSVRTMLGCIPEKYRTALEMTDLQGISQVELAENLALSVSGAKSRVQRAREKLKEAFLDCCHFEFDRLGMVMDYHPRCEQCAREPDPCDNPPDNSC